MNITVRILGCEVLHIATGADPPEPGEDRADVVATDLIGFEPPPATLPIREPGRTL